MHPLRVAILGQGRSGRDIHGHWLRQVPETFQIVAAVDPLEERRERARQEYACDMFEDYRALLDRDGLDLVINAAPSHLHVPITLDLLSHGFNVLCDKPLARRVAEVDALIAAARQSGAILAILQQSRNCLPFYRKCGKLSLWLSNCRK